MNRETSPTGNFENSTGTSPLVLSFLMFSLVLVILGGGFAAWKYFQKQQSASSIALRAKTLPAYEEDPKTGKLARKGELPENIWPEGGVADFTLIDQKGRKITKKTLEGKPWAACFVFSRCASHCLKIMSGMKQMSEELKGSDVRLVTITVDPDYDTQEVFADYAEGFEADPDRWLFLTGDQEEIYRLIQESFLLQVQEVTGPDRKPGYEVDHTKEIMHVNAGGRVVGQYNGLKEKDRRELVEALKREAESLDRPKPRSSDLPDIGEFELTERSGEAITNEDLLGQPWAVCFVFTRCAGQCLNITANMAKLQRELDGAPVRLVTITVDPDYDTPKVLKNYAENFGADPDRWLFLTGKQDYIYRLLRGYFRQLVKEMTGEKREKGFEVVHTSDVLHIDAQGDIVKKYNGLSDVEMAKLRRALLEEAEELAETESPPASTKPEISSKKPAVAEKTAN